MTVDNEAFWLVFLFSALLLNISPGPDLLYILSRTISSGKKVGIASALGVCSGAFVHVVLAACGVSALIAASENAFDALKYAGAAYLLYLGVKSVMASTGSVHDQGNAQAKQYGVWQAYKQGILIDVFNPKVALFFLAFLPQFVQPSMGAPALQIFLLGSLVILVAIVVEVSFVLVAAKATERLRTHPNAGQWLDRVMGAVLIGLSIRLATTVSL
ncbi:LysE family translocator [Pseudomonas sp. YL-218 TE3947]|uniref:LysE family translocator n=1 Tax=Pseudomonas TaxID=286 RepID=UPI0026B15818